MSYRKLGRTSSQRKALLRDLTTDLIMNESITTTEARAKEVRSTTEKMITLGKKGTLAARRQAAAFIRDEIADVREEGEKVVVQTVLQKLFSDVAPRLLNVTVVTHKSTRPCLVAAMAHQWLF